MAASIPLLFQAQIPVTPPPEYQTLVKETPPDIAKTFYHGLPNQATSSRSQERSGESPQPPQAAQRPDTSNPAGHIPPPKPPSDPPAAPAAMAAATAAGTGEPVDPRYVAMASRLASYYQQRCRAVTRLQQQRFQAWANAQRQKCQELMQAATVIVAWYIRDRIARRRRRRNRAFRRGLAQRSAASTTVLARDGRITKGEAVRRWVMAVPLAVASPMAGGRELPGDKEEASFDVDRVAGDKDGRLFNLADNLIKRHLAGADAPLLGVLSLDESESDSESEDEDFVYYEDEEEEDEDEEEEGEDEEGDEAVEGREHEGCGGGEERRATASLSKEAQLGTTIKGSGQRSRSSADRFGIIQDSKALG
ncbi:hypothetical protein VTK56DRAFT_2034 [Thermocarpiscus australiensis]